MGSRTAAERIYRDGARFKLDLRDVNGKRETLRLPGASRGVTDRETALQLAEARLAELDRERADARQAAIRARMLGLDASADLLTAAAAHLDRLESEARDPTHVSTVEALLRRAAQFFEEVQPATDPTGWARRGVPARPRFLATISVPDVVAFTRWLGEPQNMPGRRGRGLAPGTVRHHLSALSGVFETAQLGGAQLSNPVPLARRQAPPIPDSPTEHLEADEIALVLEAARRYDPTPTGALPCVYPLVAFLVYTGAREDEARRTTVRDVDFKRAVVRIPGAVKGRKSAAVKRADRPREVRLAPHLAEVLREHIGDRDVGPLFPARVRKRGEGDQEEGDPPPPEPFGDWDRALDTIGRAGGVGALGTRRFRVSFATHYSACEGVTFSDVKAALGHSSLQMLAQVYGRARRHRVRFGADLDFRVDFLADQIPDLPARVAAVRIGDPVQNASSRQVVERFRAAAAGVPLAELERLTGIDGATLARVRAGQGTVQPRNRERMEAWLDGLRERRAG